MTAQKSFSLKCWKVPGVAYTFPEVASVGKTEEQVKALGVSYRVGKFPFLANSWAKAIDDAEGIVKILAEKETDKILGVHIMALNAGELIHEAVIALSYEATNQLGYSVHVPCSYYDERSFEGNCNGHL